MLPPSVNLNAVTAHATLILINIVCLAVLQILADQQNKIPMHTSILTGQMWVDELLGGHDRRFYNGYGMEKHVFLRLIRILREKGGLHHTKHVDLEEQLAIFLHMVVTGCSNRKAQERFQRSGDTISKYVYFSIDFQRSK